MRCPYHSIRGWALQRLALYTGRTLTVSATTFWGDRLRVTLPELVSTSLLRYGYIEEALTRSVIACLRPGKVFFDVGAHYGYYSLLASHLVGSEGAVHAFEASPSTYCVLVDNTSHRPNVRANNVAVFSSECTVKIRDFGTAFSSQNSVYGMRGGARLRSSYARTAGAAAPNLTEVRACTLDAYAAATGVCPDFVEIAVEGAELDVLEGMADLLARCQPLISMEVGDSDDLGMPRSRTAVDLLLRLGYSVFELSQGSCTRHRPLDRYAQGDLLFIPGRHLSASDALIGLRIE